MTVGRELVRDALHHGDPLLPEHAHLVRVVGHQLNARIPKMLEDLCRNGEPPLVSLEAKPLIGIDRVETLVLELIGLELVDESDPAPLLCEVEQDPRSLFADRRNGAAQLVPAIAFQ